MKYVLAFAAGSVLTALGFVGFVIMDLGLTVEDESEA